MYIRIDNSGNIVAHNLYDNDVRHMLSNVSFSQYLDDHADVLECYGFFKVQDDGAASQADLVFFDAVETLPIKSEKGWTRNIQLVPIGDASRIERQRICTDAMRDLIYAEIARFSQELGFTGTEDALSFLGSSVIELRAPAEAVFAFRDVCMSEFVKIRQSMFEDERLTYGKIRELSDTVLHKCRPYRQFA